MTKPKKKSVAYVRARKRQGNYLGLLRKLKGRRRAQVRRCAQTAGVTAAIELALDILRV